MFLNISPIYQVFPIIQISFHRNNNFSLLHSYHIDLHNNKLLNVMTLTSPTGRNRLGTNAIDLLVEVNKNANK